MNAEDFVKWVMVGIFIVGILTLTGWFIYGADMIYNYEFSRFTIIQIGIGWGITIGVVAALEYLLGMMYALFGIRNRVGSLKEDNTKICNKE